MYQPDQLSSLIIQARLNGHKDVLLNLQRAQGAMMLANLIDASPEYVKLGWRQKCEPQVLTLEDVL